jgi:hypothetical protein
VAFLFISVREEEKGNRAAWESEEWESSRKKISTAPLEADRTLSTAAGTELELLELLERCRWLDLPVEC